MARYLPRDYDPIPDALLYGKADLVDVTRRIARNQNWIWANHGNVLAAFGHEPSPQQTPSVTGVAQVDAAYFAVPNRTATGSDQVRCCGYTRISGTTTTLDGRLRLYQLLPGESAPTSLTPYDEVVLTGAVGVDLFFDFTARIQTGDDPLGFCLRLLGVGGNTATHALLSCTVTWKRNPTSVLGETVAPWQAISQGYVTPNRPASAALLRAISNRTLGLMAQNPRPIFAHSFVWPRIRTDVLVAETRVALYTQRHDALTGTAPRITVGFPFLVTGQGAQVRWRVYVNGVFQGTYLNLAPALASGVYLDEEFPGAVVNAVAGAAGDMKIEVTAQCITAATAPPTYCTNVGGALLGCNVHAELFVADLGLPGVETVPAAYQPLDELACSPGSSVVAQNDRLGRRAGPYYLVKNLIWLAANRTKHTLVADWLHRTEAAGWDQGGNLAGDGAYRNQTIHADKVQALPTWWFEEAPAARDIVPWVDRPAPTIPWRISDAGHHFVGDVLGRFYCRPLNGGQVAAILRADVFYGARPAGFAQPPGDDVDLEFYIGSTRDVRVRKAGRKTGGFRLVGVAGARPSAGTILSLRAHAGTYVSNVSGDDVFQSTYGDIVALSRVEGVQAALNSAYIYEAPLEQTELDALA